MITFKPKGELPVDYQVSLRNVLGITFLTLLIAVLLGVIVVQLDPTVVTGEKGAVKTVMWLHMFLLVGVLTATGYVLAWRTPKRWGIVGLVAPSPRWVLISVAVGTVMFFMVERIDHMFGLGILESFRGQFGKELQTQIGFLSMAVTAGIVRPVAYEIFFRGVLFNFFANRLGVQAGLFVTAALFAAMYYKVGLPANLAFGFVYGLAFGLLFQRSGSLWTAIVANATLGLLFAAKAAWV